MKDYIKEFSNYLLVTRNTSQNTIKAYSSDLKLLEAFLLTIDKTLISASNDDLEAYFAANTASKRTYNRKITAFVEFYNYLSSIKVDISLNSSLLEHAKNETRNPLIIKYEDIARMIASFDDSLNGNRNKTIISLIYVTGLRVSEIVNLTYNDINLDEGYIRCIGKGNKEKIISVGELLKIILLPYTNNTRKKILNGLTSEYVFVNKEGDPLTRQTVFNIIKEAAKRANIYLEVSPHTLRHCFATHMIENGADIRTVQEMLGHKDISTTQIYTNVTKNVIRKNYLAKFNDPMKGVSNMKFKRVFVIVCDSMGIGNGKDAKKYNDFGSNTFKHIDDKMNLNIPELRSLGIAKICNLNNKEGELDHAYCLAMNEASLGKDTLTGHYELMGLKVTQPFKTFTDTGFPQELIDELETKWNRKIIGNKSASGTEIIKELGERQLKTGEAIVYTSSDSVLQIAAHQDVISLEELYHMCEIAREITKQEKYKLGRIIARPFEGTCAENFKRTPFRHDYALKPFAPTMLNILKDNNYDVISIGKIVDIFDGEGITDFTKIKNNDDGCEQIINRMKQDFTGLCFANLVDFDMEYGHRRNVEGYGKAIEKFDSYVSEFKKLLNVDDIMFITADHGNDPTWQGSDHTREQVPLLIYSKAFKYNGVLPESDTFSDLASTIASNFNVTNTGLGKSLLEILK